MVKKFVLSILAMFLFGMCGSADAAENPFADVPQGHWAYAALSELERGGLLSAGKAYDGDRIITRYEMAQLVGAALANKNNVSSDIQLSVLPRLTDEFAEELDSLGVRVAKLETAQDNVRFNGQVRWHYADNERSLHSDSNAHQLRSRIYLTGKVNEKWNYYAMLENKQDLMSNEEEGRTAFARAYLKGPVGCVQVTGGRFSNLMSEGNIYDTGFEGIKLDFGDVIKYSLSYGEANDKADNKMFVASAYYKDYDYNAAVGYHHIDYDDIRFGSNTIWTAGANYDFGNYSLGAMYLLASEKDARQDNDGYVFTLRHGRVKAWKRGTYEIYTKYYDQAVNTYIAHTMSGLAGYMDGFRGYCLGTQYAVMENAVLSIEYYNLRDKITDEKNKTIWTQVIFDLKLD